MRGISVILAAFGVALAANARADIQIVDFDDGTHAARATFEVTDLGDGNSQLTITLENLASSAASVPIDALTGLWFNIPNPTSLSGGIVDLATGASIVNPGEADSDPDGDGLDSDGRVTGEFGMENNAADVQALKPDSNVVIANAGLGDLVGTDDLFSGENLDDPDAPDGMNYGILPYSGLDAGANAPMFDEPWIAGGVVITLDYAGALSAADITGVAFNYGTDANFVIPVPGAGALALVGMGLVGIVRRRLA